MHGAGNFNDVLEVAEYPLVAVDVGLEDLPIVDAGLPRRAGVGQNKARLDFFRRDGYGFAVNAVGIEMYRAGSPVKRGIIILAAGGYLDDLGLDILGDDAHLLEGEVAVR